MSFDPKKFDPKKTIFLIDGSSFLYRSYYGLRPLHSPKGEAVQAVYGFCRMIKKLIDTFHPEHIALVWDSKGKTTRHEMFENYKATRQAPPSDLFTQKEHIIKFAELIGLRQIAQQGIEADDIMFSIAREQKEKSFSVVVVTSDKDMGQMLDEKTYMYDTFKDLLTDAAQFQEKNGFPVSKLPFYFALLGDTSDNIPGVKGIGDKGAAELVNQFESLEDLYENLDKVRRPSTAKALQENKDNAFLSRKLFLLQYHPTHLSLNDLAFDEVQWAQARPLFEELNFKSLIKDMPSPALQTSIFGAQPQAVMKKYDFRLVTTAEQLRDLCALLKTKKAFAMDTETTGVRPLQDEFVGMSFCAAEGIAYYVPFGHKTDEQQLSRDEIFAAIAPLLADESIHKYFHHTKFDQLVLYASGLILRGAVFDTIVAARLAAKIDQRVGLKTLSVTYFDEPMLSYEDVVKQNKLKDFSYVPLDLAAQYSCADAHQTYRLVKILKKELKDEKLMKLYDDIEHPLIQVLFEMEAAGINIDVEKIKAIDGEVTLELQRIRDAILDLIGHEFKDINLNSTKQVGELLFEKLQLPTQKKSAKGTSYSTDVEVLTELSKVHPVPGLIKKYRELAKLKSTYLEALPTYINPKTGNIHTTYSQTAVATGRLASSDPNLQNIPADAGYGADIRSAFVPKPGHVFLSADYSQIELRVLAHFSQDKNLIDAFLHGHDIHAETAARLFDVPLAEVSHDQRQIGKRINFSILYGLTPYGLSKDLDISFADAKRYIEKYFAQYPAVHTWMETVIDDAKKNGYVSTWYGRRRYVPAIYEKNRALYEEARRVAVNTVAQGTAADIMKLGMIKVDAALKAVGADAHIVLQIHDELLLSVGKDQQEEVQKIVQRALESVVSWQVPLQVSMRFGNDWKEASK